MAFTDNLTFVSGEVVTAAKMNLIGDNDDYLKAAVDEVAPVSAITGYMGAADPVGWLICNGRNVSRTTYADLFAIWGTKFGAGDGSTTFALPNLQERTLIGVGGSAGMSVVGDYGGEKNVTLSIGTMPHHAHYVHDPGHAHIAQSATNQIVLKIIAASDGAHGISDGATARWTDHRATGIWLGGEGGGQAHNNMQPYMAQNWIVKT